MCHFSNFFKLLLSLPNLKGGFRPGGARLGGGLRPGAAPAAAASDSSAENVNTANGGDSARKPLIYSKQMLLSLRDEDYCVCRPDDLIGKYYLSFVRFECLIMIISLIHLLFDSRRIFATQKI